ncbi:MAG: pyruvate oxidase, partial [Thermomicrobiaceae bacterium]|nr:pyruvate oxidase [Thermomicrobiaceae bacterium]
MATTAADLLIDRLIDWGVDTIFGLPGDGVNGIFEALRTRQDRIRFIQVRHEEAAAFMACGYAKYTGRLGVCLATSGPGGIHLLNGLYDAKLDQQPVLAIAGHTFHDLIGTRYQQDVDLEKLYMDVAVYSELITGPAHVVNSVDEAIRLALTHRGVSCLVIPKDIQTEETGEEHRSPANVPRHSADIFARPHPRPSDDARRQAAEILNRGSKVAILAGQGALGARAELEQVADLLAAPIVKPLLGKATVPDTSPYTTGGIGLLGTRPSQEALEECDTLLIVGSSFPYIEFYPRPGQARAVQIDIDPSRIGLRYAVDVGLPGDSREVLQLLIPLLQRKSDRGFLETAQERMKDWWDLMKEQGTRQDTPMKPQVVAYELDRLLRDDAIVSADSGTIATWAARFVRIRGDMKFSLSGTLATMANGFPYSIAAQVAYPDRQVVAIVGDGGFTMLMGELATCVKYHLPVKVIIFKNNTLGQIKWEQMVFEGNPEFGVELQPIDFAKYAEACGAAGFTAEDPKDVRGVLEAALSHPGPAVVQAVVDPNEPPMPPKVTFE